MKTALKVGAVVVGGVAALDLAAGGTNSPILPDFLGNLLTQQTDLVLILIAVLLFIFA